MGRKVPMTESDVLRANLKKVQKEIRDKEKEAKDLEATIENRRRDSLVDLKEYTTQLMFDLESGRIKIDQLTKVFIRRLDGNNYMYYDAFHIGRRYKGDSRPSNFVEKSEISYIRRDDPRAYQMEKVITEDKVMIYVSNELKHYDGSLIGLGDMIMELFALHYRKNGDADNAIAKVKSFFEKPPKFDRYSSGCAFDKVYHDYISKLLET